MTAAVVEDEPRRGQRVRKQPKMLVSVMIEKKTHSKGKKRALEEDEGSELSEVDSDAAAEDDAEPDEESEESEEDEDDEPVRTKSKGKSSAKGKKVVSSKKQPAKRKTPAKKAAAAIIDAEGLEKGVDGIKTDNGLFNAMLQPDIALQSFVEEWVEAYLETSGDEEAENQIINELVLFFIRCCGLNSEVDSDESVDRDGIVDTVERIQDEGIAAPQATYPLISRSKAIKPFRNNVTQFLHHLIITLSASPLLYKTPTHNPRGVKHVNPLVHVILNWLVPMSSCHYRPLRHTATYLVLKLKTALADVAVQVVKELEAAQRQRDAEMKKSGKGARLADAEKRVKENTEKKLLLESYMDDLLDGTFTFRSRDSEALIRTECMRELGIWMKRYPERFVDVKYMHYYDWSITDINTATRLETIRGLKSLFLNEANLSNVRSFAFRVTPRLLQVALRDVDLSVRVAAIEILTLIEKAELMLEDDEEGRERIAWLIFDQEPKIQRAIGEMVKIIWADSKEVEEKLYMAEKKRHKKGGDELDEEQVNIRFTWKALARLLIRTSQDLDRATSKAAGTSTLEQSQSSISMRDLAHTASATALQAAGTRGRAAAAVEGLWNEIEQIQDWDSLVQYLLLDHTEVDDADGSWGLNEEEETFLVSMLVAILERLSVEASSKKVESDDTTEQTRVLIKALPQLLAKHQADAARMTDLLQIPQYIKLEMYLELRMANAYDNLWDDVTRQVLQQTEAKVLQVAIRTIIHLSRNTAMMTANKEKLSELQDALITSLRDAVAGRDVETATFSDDEIANVEAIMQRLSLLAMAKDLVETLEDVEGGQSSGWEIVLAFAERGKLGYSVEVRLAGFALQTLSAYIAWSAQRFSKTEAEDEGAVSSLETKRDRICALFEEFAIGDRSNAKEAVRRNGYFSFINLYIIFSPRAGVHERPAATRLPMEMDDSQQFRLCGRLQISLERFASEIEENVDSVDDPSDSEDEDETEKAGPRKKRRIDLDGSGVSLSRREIEHEMLQDAAAFISAVRVGVIEAQHSAIPLAHYGRFGSAYDACARTLIDVLRDEGIYNNDGEMTQKVIGQALQDSFELFLASTETEPTATLALSKVAANAFVVHGTHFTVLKKIDSKCLLDFHNEAVEWIAGKIANGVRLERSIKSNRSKEKAHKSWTNALSYFKALVPLLPGIDGRAALRIKSTLQEAFKAADVNPSASLKEWEAQRTYEKRLISLASKDPYIKSAATLKFKNKARAEDDGENEEQDDDARRAAGSPAPTKRRKVAAAPRAATRNRIERRAKNVSSAIVEDDEEEEDEDVEAPEVQEEEDEDIEGTSATRGKRPRDADEVSETGSLERRSPSEGGSEPGTQVSRAASVGSVDMGPPVKRTRRG